MGLELLIVPLISAFSLKRLIERFPSWLGQKIVSFVSFFNRYFLLNVTDRQNKTKKISMFYIKKKLEDSKNGEEKGNEELN